MDRFHWKLTWIWLFFFLGAGVESPVVAQRRIGESVPTSWQDDAELTSVHFIDRQRGWAVGEHGTILKTNDGGKSWQHCSTEVALSVDQGRLTPEMERMINSIRKQTGTDAATVNQSIRQNLDVRLEAIRFLNDQRGIAVGGYHSPATGISRGVVFSTTDGGLTWVSSSGVLLPKLNELMLMEGGKGWALGNQSYTLGTGVLTTTDGGKNWFSDRLAIPGDWQAGSRAGNDWVLLNQKGELFVSQGDQIEGVVWMGVHPQRIHQVAMFDERWGLAVGDAGTVIETMDGGHSWRPALSGVDQSQLQSFDLRTITWNTTGVWMAGNPGTRVFRFDPAKRSLQSFSTPTRNRLNALQMFDESFGCAVGGNGTVLTTDDGGQTWQRRRGQVEGVALLALCFDPAQIPLEVLAKSTLGDGYYSAVVHLNLTGSRSASENMVAALTRIGINEVRVLDFPVAQSGMDESVRGALTHRLARLICELEPHVVLADRSVMSGLNSQRIDVTQLLNEAIRLAAHEAEGPGQQKSLTGIGPWQVQRLAIPTEFEEGHFRLDRHSLMPRTGKRLDDEIALSRLHLGLPLGCSGVVNYRVQDYSGHLPELHANLLAGLSDSSSGPPRRRDAKLMGRNLREIGRTLDKSQGLKQIAALPLITLGDKMIWEQHLRTWLQEVDRESAGVWLAQLVDAYYAKGDLLAASLTVDFLLTQYPDHPVGTLALASLATFVASQEIQIAMGTDLRPNREMLSVTQAVTRNQDVQLERAQAGPIATTTWTPMAKQVETASKSSDAHQVEPTAFAADAEKIEPPAVDSAYWASAVQQFVRLRQRDPELANHPLLRGLEAHVIRHGDSWPKSSNLFKQLSLSSLSPEGTRNWAARELELHSEHSLNPQQLIVCEKIRERPKLDGDLSDSAWQQIMSSRASEAGQSRSFSPALPGEDQVLLAYDDEFLFISIKCKKIPGLLYQAPNRNRTRNPNLEMYDRVELIFDLDRNCSWPLCLQIDSRGWAADDCGGSPGWDPTWFVAATQESDQWSAEAAIPWSQLGGCPPSNSHWAFAMSRRLPRKSENVWQKPTPPMNGSFFAMPEFSTDRYQLLKFN